MKNIFDLIIKRNKKIMFTPGPASLLYENIFYLSPAFGRGDKNYKKVENKVMSKLKKMSKKKNIIHLQGSGSLAIEVMVSNFLYGKVLILESGYYSNRLAQIAQFYLKNFKIIKKIEIIKWNEYHKINKSYDWIFFCYTETSVGLKLPLKEIYRFCKKKKIKIMMDATASFGLEKNHELADVFSYSSCKGLFGLTGASFVSYNTKPKKNVNSFNLSLETYKNKKTTGPYHAIYSLYKTLEQHKNIKQSILINKKKFLKVAKPFLKYPLKYQPLLCTRLNIKVKTKNSNVILYEPRGKIKGSVVCHLGEAHLKSKAKGKIIDNLIIK